MCIVDCPLCDGAVRYEPGDDEFDCPACAVRVAVAADPEVIMALAA